MCWASAFQNKMVADLAEGAGIKSQTIASFVLANERYLTERDTPRYEEGARAARRRDAGRGRDLDGLQRRHAEASQHRRGARHRQARAGWRSPAASSIDAGKSFAMIQAAGGTMARMDENIRQRTDTLRTVAALANVGKAGEAMKVPGR